VVMKFCRRHNCRSRNRKAVWLVDRVPLCASCMERTLALMTDSFDQHQIVRLSEEEKDFGEKSAAYTARAMA